LCQLGIVLERHAVESRQYIQLDHPDIVVKAIREVLNVVAGSHPV
jgi:hypothetical protein